MNIIEVLAKEFGLKQSQVEQTVNLIDEGNTIPFIARYRKEATGGLSDVVLRDLDERADIPSKSGGEKRRGHPSHRRAGQADR